MYCVQNVFELEEFCPKNVSTYCTWLSNNAIDILRRKCISCAKLFTYGIIYYIENDNGLCSILIYILNLTPLIDCIGSHHCPILGKFLQIWKPCLFLIWHRVHSYVYLNMVICGNFNEEADVLMGR